MKYIESFAIVMGLALWLCCGLMKMPIAARNTFPEWEQNVKY